MTEQDNSTALYLNIVMIVIVSINTFFQSIFNFLTVSVKLLKRSKCCGAESVFQGNESIHLTGQDVQTPSNQNPAKVL